MRETVIVTGGSRGIGLETALAFARNEYNVVITCKSSVEELKDAEAKIKTLGVDCISCICDGTDFERVLEVYNKVMGYFGRVDVLINNSGIAYFGLLQEMTNEHFDSIIKNNLYSVFNWSRQVIPEMVAMKKGKIINISSIWGEVGASCEVAYSASKGAVDSFTKALAKELGPSNIQVNGVALGVIETKMNDFVDLDVKEKLREEIPMGRFGTPKEIGEIICDLAKGKEYITGQIIKVDGGFK
ncbi:MAG: SDR family NAD(P)-dependent oxidoreductase [Anaerovoracaceae bacterium]